MTSPTLLLWLTAPAWACPVCGGGGANAQAFFDTMVFLSLLPLTLMGGLALFYRQRLREQAQRTAEPGRASGTGQAPSTG